MSLQNLKSVFPASKRQYIAACSEVQVPWGRVHELRKTEERDWHTV